ncbi:radical SAM protein [Paraburkholderia xenovorans]
MTIHPLVPTARHNPPAIDTAGTAQKYRSRILNLDARSILVSRLDDSDQARDLTVPANCGGFGRIRHFRRGDGQRWPRNPLPIDPASRGLGLPPSDALEAQVFQNAACAWRCWYCFVPYNLLSADQRRARWMTADEMLDLFLAERQRPRVIDLTGGSPDLTPEWIAWFMEAMIERGLEKDFYLWSDDNLSTDFFWNLAPEHKKIISSYRMYGRVACFKGFDAESFAFNTAASSDEFERQLTRFSRLAGFGIDLYAYVTLTSPYRDDLETRIEQFVDRLCSIHANLPLRTVPLEIQAFSPVLPRLDTSRERALEQQQRAITAWKEALQKRYSSEQLAMPITEVRLD